MAGAGRTKTKRRERRARERKEEGGGGSGRLQAREDEKGEMERSGMRDEIGCDGDDADRIA